MSMDTCASIVQRSLLFEVKIQNSKFEVFQCTNNAQINKKGHVIRKFAKIGCEFRPMSLVDLKLCSDEVGS